MQQGSLAQQHVFLQTGQTVRVVLTDALDVAGFGDSSRKLTHVHCPAAGALPCKVLGRLLPHWELSCPPTDLSLPRSSPLTTCRQCLQPCCASQGSCSWAELSLTKRCPLAGSSLRPRSPAQLRSRGPAQGFTFSASPGLPADVSAPERQRSHPWGMDFLADCSNRQLSLSKEWRESDSKSMACPTRAQMSMRGVDVPLWARIFLAHNKKDTQAVTGRCWLNALAGRGFS